MPVYFLKKFKSSKVPDVKNIFLGNSLHNDENATLGERHCNFIF